MSRKPQSPPWAARAREIAARAKAPTGQPFSMKKDGKRASLYLYDEIGFDPWFETGIAATDIVQAVKDAEGAEALDIHVNSPGGYVFEGIAIFNAIRSFKGEKVVYVDGIAASIASVIALAGDKVITSEGAMWMIHDPAGGVFAFGTAEEIENDARKTVTALRKVRENILDIYAAHTGKSLAELSAWMGAETWMTAAEAKARGFTDEVASNAMGCDCTCPECADGECADCSCGGCAACEEGDCPGCDASAKAKAAAKVTPVAVVPVALSPAQTVANARAMAAAARAQAVSLSERFPAASRGAAIPASRATK